MSLNLRVVVTAGATREYLDQVRFVSNTSTGQTGISLCRALAAAGHEVMLLRGEGVQDPGDLASKSFKDAEDLASVLDAVMKEWDPQAVIQGAAVSDYGIAGLRVNGELLRVGEMRKVPSDLEGGLELVLKRNKKVIDRIRKQSKRPSELTLIGFKLTVGANPEERDQAALSLLRRSGADMVVHNDYEEISGTRHPFVVYSRAGVLARGETLEDLGTSICGLLEERQ